MRFVQYPYKLFVKKTTEGGGYDDNGFPVEAENEWVFHSKCRDELQSMGNHLVTTESGEEKSYSLMIVMPKGTDYIKANTSIKVTDEEGTRFEGSVILFASKQLHCRLWA